MAGTKVKLQEKIDEIVEALNNLKDDEALPKNVKTKIENIIATLQDGADISTKVGKSLQSLDEISEDLNLQPFIRTQIWNISSMFEKLNK